MKQRADGITVLICTYNGEDTLPQTLRCLACQKNYENINWEIIVVNNASTDNTVSVAEKEWNLLRSNVAFSVINEFRRGKDHAVDLGFELAKYAYVIICDDDNWLSDSYVEIAYQIMKKMPEIGILGGMGIAEFEDTPPSWFNNYKIYYAVGEQNILSGEIRHYWPTYQLIWGAGSVINLRAYDTLICNGFERILSSDRHSKVSRSDDAELCFAIWLAGYKVWYDKRLVYRHLIKQDKLKWKNISKIIRWSDAAIHYLRPYNILIFTGCENAPQKSFWMQYITHFFKNCINDIMKKGGGNLALQFLLGKGASDVASFQKAKSFYQFFDAVKLGRGYDVNFQTVRKLQKKLQEGKAE